MKPPNAAPCYAAYYKSLAEVAREKGYALAVHGSLQNDLDLIAVPWVENAAPREELVEAIRAMCGGLLVSEVRVDGRKPHGGTRQVSPSGFPAGVGGQPHVWAPGITGQSIGR